MCVRRVHAATALLPPTVHSGQGAGGRASHAPIETQAPRSLQRQQKTSYEIQAPQPLQQLNLILTVISCTHTHTHTHTHVYMHIYVHAYINNAHIQHGHTCIQRQELAKPNAQQAQRIHLDLQCKTYEQVQRDVEAEV